MFSPYVPIRLSFQAERYAPNCYVVAGVTLLGKRRGYATSVQYSIQCVFEAIFGQGLGGETVMYLQSISKHLKDTRTSDVGIGVGSYLRLDLKLSNYSLGPRELALAKAGKSIREALNPLQTGHRFGETPVASGGEC